MPEVTSTPGASTLVPSTDAHAGARVAHGAPPPPGPLTPFEQIRHQLHRFFKRHGHKLWWLHSAYALTLGTCVVMFARKGYDHARWLAVSVGLAWLLVVFFFRLFGSGTREQSYSTAASTGKLRFLVMTYVLKNLYQGMLFFLLPFYWQSATLTSAHAGYIGVVGACALLSTMDVVFDRFVMRWRVLASMFHAFILFGTLNLILPAFLPTLDTLATLCAAAGISMAAFWTLHVPFSAFRNRWFVMVFLASIAGSAAVASLARRAVPPVPLYLDHGAVGPAVLPDGRLTMEVQRVNRAVLVDLVAVTDVMALAGRNDRLSHVWRQNGAEVFRVAQPHVEPMEHAGWRRLRSSL
ncbi:MAG: DUF5924 family protein, partial [Deltaproteobacteria bacterium]